MPTSPPSPCTWKGWPPCPTLVPGGGRCEQHIPPRAKDDRPSAAQRGYGSAWQTSVAGFLLQHPVCADCGGQATVGDHDPVERAELVAMGDPDPDAWHHLVPRCGPCHNAKTARTRPGGWNRRPTTTDRPTR